MRHPVEIFVGIQQICMILPLWREGKNTLDIAIALGLPEFEVANRLPTLLEGGRMPKLITAWTDERTENLKKYWSGEYSCSQIANLLGGTTRNAVIGKVHRLGLAGRRFENPFKKSSEHHAERIRLKNERRRLRRQEFAPPPREWERQIICTEIEPRNIDLSELERDDCRWPDGDGPFTFCGAPKFNGFSYCAGHYFASIGPGTPSERSAQKISAVHLEPFA